MKKLVFLILCLSAFLSLPPYSLLSQDDLKIVNFSLKKTVLDKERLEEEPSFTLSNTQDHNYLATHYAKEYGVNPNLIKAIIKTESRGKPNSVSHKGASGLMQLMPETAKSLGVKDIFDPGENIKAGVRYFKMMLDRFDGNVKLALAAYNAGPSRVEQQVSDFEQTNEFVKKVLHYYYEFRENDETTRENS